MGKRKKKIRKTGQILFSFCMACILLLTLIAIPVKADTISIQNPQIMTDTSLSAGVRVTWDCVWFGSYPQSEITAADGSIYTKLKNASGWDIKGDVTIDGVKYRRIRKGDATNYTAATKDGVVSYPWADAITYHYFKYEPIKWRVLDTGGRYFLLADKILDSQMGDANTSDHSVAWDFSTMRSWLNGYDASVNRYGMDYTGNNFIDSAFSGTEKAAILTASLECNGIDWQNSGWVTSRTYVTQDKVFLLSEDDTFGEALSAAYGFTKGKNEVDEGRQSLTTTYAHAMGVWTYTNNNVNGYAPWYLRTATAYGTGTDVKRFRDITSRGERGYAIPNTGQAGTRPALYLNASALTQFRYAGTVCSNGTVNEKNIAMTTAQPPSGNDNTNNNTSNTTDHTNNGTTAAPNHTSTQKLNPTFAYTKSYNKTYGDKAFALQARLKTGDGSLSYKSSNPKVASISSKGKVTIKGTGSCIITISTKATSHYNARSVQATILVKPKRAALKTLKPGKKQMKLTWQKDTRANGYQLQYSTSKKFTKKTTKTVTIKTNKTISRTVKKLKTGKKYYVRVRSYRNTKVNGKNRTLYGTWSKVKLSKKIK